MLDITGPVAITGDWHMNKPFVHQLFTFFKTKHPEIETIINCGDMCYWEHGSLDWLNTLAMEHHIMIYWIDGNHEKHSLLSQLPQDSHNFGIIGSHVKYIPRGTAFMMNGQKVVTMGGTTSVGRERLLRESCWDTDESITDENMEKALTHESADIMITHEAPYGMKTVEERIHRVANKFPHHEVAESLSQRVKIRKLVEALTPHTIYHGHHHHRYDETLLLRSGKELHSMGLGRDGDKFHHILNNFTILQ